MASLRNAICMRVDVTCDVNTSCSKIKNNKKIIIIINIFFNHATFTAEIIAE
jgi:hypothetical protein